MRSVRPYSVLAGGYDFVMRHVDYAAWAAYVHALIQTFHPAARTVLELGCGTGSFGMELTRRGAYRYHGSDRSPEMVECARIKAAEGAEGPLSFSVADFRQAPSGDQHDIVLLLYDGINYCLEPDDVRGALGAAAAAVAPGGVFLLDQSTPANSADNEAFFEDSGADGIFAYRRSSAYDGERGLHRTVFELAVDGRSFREEHVQRAYTVAEMRRFLDASGWSVAALYDGFGLEPASERSHRVQWVLTRADRETQPDTQ